MRYYKDNNSTYLALASGRIDAYFGPNPGIAYQDQQSARHEHADPDGGHVLRRR